MGLFKPDLYRFFAIGFLAGAVLVFAQVGDGGRSQLAENVVPTAEAASAR